MTDMDTIPNLPLDDTLVDNFHMQQASTIAQDDEDEDDGDDNLDITLLVVDSSPSKLRPKGTIKPIEVKRRPLSPVGLNKQHVVYLVSKNSKNNRYEDDEEDMRMVHNMIMT